MTSTLENYRERREAMLARIVNDLAMDERFVAGWLTGSYARGEADALSDIDLGLAVAGPYSEVLCQRLEQVSSGTSPERYLLFSLFGTPALIHENNHNAPEDGTFTFVLYSGSALMVDWILVPQSKAIRPFRSKLLFDKIRLPVAPAPEPESLAQSKKAAAETWSFFWMMAAVTIKYIRRGDGVFASHWIESLHGMLHEIERRINCKPWEYRPSSHSSLQLTSEEQLQSLQELCNRMLDLKGRLSEFTGSEPLTPITEIKELLTLAQQSKIVNPKSSI